jgi:hypothetical protein
MAFTDNCDLYGAVHEDGINRVLRHLMLQRPSLFNYATAEVASNRELWCADVPHTDDVIKYGNPLFTIMPPLPLLGADSPQVVVGYCVQLTRGAIDFHPGNAINLTVELSPPLKPQRFALEFRGCGGIVCPSDKEIERIPFGSAINAAGIADVRRDPITLHGRPNCFCLRVLAVGHVERRLVNGQESLLGVVDAVDIDDIDPDKLEDNITCYIKASLNAVLREKLTIPLQTFMFSFPLFGMGTVNLFPTPNPPVPDNPAVEDDQLKAFVSMQVI